MYYYNLQFIILCCIVVVECDAMVVVVIIDDNNPSSLFFFLLCCTYIYICRGTGQLREPTPPPVVDIRFRFQRIHTPEAIISYSI